MILFFLGFPLTSYKDDLYCLFVSLLSNTNAPLRCQAILGLTGLMTVPGLLVDVEHQQVAQHYLNVILTESDANVR